ncbi:MAG: sulfite exporter TauE/SafE family protein [Butyrivibrio sp.]|nr:sulfite exporter TauE/SafE family protein [Butyrivibrio sp.]
MTTWIIATFVAFFIKGLCGFANTLVFTSILGFTESNVNISPVELVLGYPANAILAWKHREHFKAKIVMPISLLVIGGSIPGAILLKNVDVRYLKIFFGIVVALIGVEMMLKEYDLIKDRKSGFLMLIIGLLSGILCGLFGVGVLVAAYVSRVTKTTDEFKGNISAVFFVENTFRIITYFYLGVISLASLKQSLILFPVLLLGLFSGMKSAKILNEKTAKKMVIILLIISGLSLVVRNI